MTLVRFNPKPARSFNNLVDHLFYGMPSLYRDDFPAGNTQFVPVNIRENEKEYVLEVVAPGLDKEDFKIDLENDTLSISAARKEESKTENEKLVRREYSFRSFKRSFTLDESVDANGIVAKYLNGVLTLNLPKRTDVKEAAKQISVQ